MKILYHHRIASKDGQYVHVDELTKALKKIGHEIIMVSPAVAETKEFGSDGGLVKTLKQYMPKAAYELLEFGYSFYAYYKLAKAIKEHKPDVIYERYNLFLPAGIWIKKRFKLPFLLEVNAPLYDERKKYDGIALNSLSRWTEKYAWNNADYVLPVTEVLAQRVRAEGVSVEKIQVIPNGIDLDKFGEIPDLEKAKKALGLENKLVLGFTGFVRDWHGLDKVVELVAKSSEIERHLLLVGDGPARGSIEKKAIELGVTDRLTITGIVGREEIASYVSAFDIALQPDVVDYASPLKLFEYLALGRPVIAPDKANIREILTHEFDGYLFNVNDSDAFFNAIEALCNNSELRAKLADNAQKAIEKQGLTWINNAKRVEALFVNLLEKGNHA